MLKGLEVDDYDVVVLLADESHTAYDPDSRTISGEMFSGAVSEEKFVHVIEKYLASSRTEAKLNK